VIAAHSELESGDPELARRLLGGIPLVVEQVVASAPLVPVRFDLRTAAIAAEGGDWTRATNLIGRAWSRVDALRADAEGAPEDGLARFANELARLQTRIANGDVRPQELRNLAQQTSRGELGPQRAAASDEPRGSQRQGRTATTQPRRGQQGSSSQGQSGQTQGAQGDQGTDSQQGGGAR
jgi:hypothetical protein